MAKIMHKVMLPMTGGGAVQVASVAEERGFEVIEYDLLYPTIKSRRRRRGEEG